MILRVGDKTSAGTVAKVLHTAKILHDGWESDNKAWAVELEDGTRMVFTSCHGNLCIPDRAEIEDKLRETEESLASIRTLLKIWPSHQE